MRHLYVMGIATDYCVKASAVGGIAAGFGGMGVQAGCRVVDLQPGDGRAALAAMQAAGGLVLG